MRKALRFYFLAQTICLCLSLLGAGMHIVRTETEYVATGIQTDSPVAASLWPDKPFTDHLTGKLCYAPFPVGNIAAIICSIRNIAMF